MKKVLLGLSGGTDSSVAARILQKDGFEVIGCYLLLTPDSDEFSEEAKNAEALARFLGIKLLKADFRERFRENVIRYFINEYLSGKTPNPCVRCNPTVKIRSLSDVASDIGADLVATGHYALTEESERYGGTVLKAAPSKKDQSYFLSGLSPDMLSRLIFPLGSFASKDEVREYALKEGLPNAQKPDSQEICFIPDNNYQKFILEHTNKGCTPGSFLDNDGKIIGTHSGIINYTVGQRKGLGAFGEPRYVKYINALDNTVTLCKRDERFSLHITAKNFSKAVNAPLGDRFEASVKIRSTAAAVPAAIECKDGKISIELAQRVLAPSPGQTAAFYDGDTVLGGAVICSAD